MTMQHDRLLSSALLFTVFTAYGVYLSAFESVNRNQCSRAYLGRLGSGVIASYNYPFDYRDNLTCVHRIYLGGSGSGGANGSQTLLCLTFRRFSLENSSPFCSFDYLELGSSPPMKYCGTGLWQYGVEKKGNLFSNIWSPNLCWSVQNSDKFDLVFSSDNSINGTGFHAIFQVHSSSSPVQNHLPRGASDQGPCRLTDWTCFNRKCVALRLLCDGQNDCGDWSDESYAHARCRGQNLLACDFSDGSDEDGFCAFDHEGWFRSSQEKRSRGPPFDHTNGSSSGFYIYSEGSSHLTSPQLSLSANVTYCLSFWYFIYGASPSTSLSVFISHEQSHSRPEWTHRSGEATLTHAWNLAEVTIESGASLQVIFASLSSNNESGTALDDISVTEGSCSGVDISCNFESGLCGWTSADRLSHVSGTLTADHSWKIQSDYERSSGPKSDHSSVDGSGGYLYAVFLAPVDPSSRAILVSPAVSALPDEVLCLQFWFHAGRRARSACVLSVILHHYDDVLSGDIWSQVLSGDDAWKRARIEFEADGPLQVVLLASVTSGKTDTDCEFALDELWVVRGHCTDEDGVVCDAGQYQCSSGHCIASHLVCDNIPNCRDGSDEDWRAGCFSMDESPKPGSTPQMTNVMCSSATSFLCHGSAICIPRAWLCDLFNDCGDMSDEGALAGCPVSDDLLVQNPSTFGIEADFTNYSAALPSNKVISTSAMPGCEFLCADGACVSLSQKCDGVSDCTNGYDEVNCTNVYVPPLTFCQRPSVVCLSENRCLSSEFVCDGRDDCLDASDEAASLCSDNLGYGAVAGIVFGCSFSTLFLLLVALIARRRHRKNCAVRQPHRPNRRPAHISTVFSVNNNDHRQDAGGGGGGGVSRRQIDALNAFVARSEDSEEQSQRDRDRDNMGYIDDRNRVDAAAMAAFPSELHPMFAAEDAPPSYNSVLQHRPGGNDDGLSRRGEHQRRRALLVRGSSADELEVAAGASGGGGGSGGGGDVVEDSGCDRQATQSRNRRSYRSLPPTPARQPLVSSHLQAYDDGVQQQQQSSSSPGHRRSTMLGYGSVSGHDEGRDHVHRDPSSSGAAVQRHALRSGCGSQLPPGPSQQQQPMAIGVPPHPPPAADVFHQSCSSVISPTLSSSQRAASRIRLGTMALHNRPGTAGHHGVCGSACAWHPGPVPDSVVAPQTRRQQQCYADPTDVELGGCDPEIIADPCGCNVTALDEFVVLADENSRLMMHQPYPHHKPSARVFHHHHHHGSSSPSSCLSPAVQQNNRGAVGPPRDAPTRAQTSSRRPHHQHQHHRHSVENAAADRSELDAANSIGGTETDLRSGGAPPFQRRDRCRPAAVAGDARHHHHHPAGFASAASNHRRSQSSGAFQDSSSSSASAVGSYHLPNCHDDRMFSSPTCV